MLARAVLSYLRLLLRPSQSNLYEIIIFSSTEDDVESGRRCHARCILFPNQDHQELQRFSAVSLGTEGTIHLLAFDAHNLFCILPRRKSITWNLRRRSSMRDGARRDGSFVAGTPVVLPQELVQGYPDFENHMRANNELMFELESDGVKEFKKRYKISKGGLCVADWKLSEEHEVVTNDKWNLYASHELFPYLKAATNGGHFVLRNDCEATIIRPLKPFPDLYARVARLKAIENYCLQTEHGVLVAAPWRLLISLLWFLLSLCVGVAAAVHNRNDWFESMESFFTATTIVAITLPAIVSLLVQEPELIRNAIRGKKTLTTDQQVAKWFNFTERDYAAAAISLKGTFLVSEARGCYLSGKSNSSLSGNGYLVSAGVLQHVGILVGRALYRRIWETKNRVVEEIDVNVSHLTALERTRDPRCWAASRVDDRLVG